LSARTMAELEQTNKLLDELLTSKDIFGRPRGDEREAPQQVDFAQLRAALIAIDPDLGGLRESELPESRGIAYLCLEHRNALRYPSSTRP
jgi:internalin A